VTSRLNRSWILSQVPDQLNRAVTNAHRVFLLTCLSPVPGTTFTKFYLSSKYGANSSLGDGKLFLNKSTSDRSFDSYIYDPGNPTHCLTDYLKKRATEAYNELVAKRNDVLIYETDALQESLSIVGPITAKIYASSSAIDTDWCVMLYGISEDDEIFPIGMTWGVLRARYRTSIEEPDFLVENKIYEFEIDIGHTGYTFSKGDRIRMEVSSALFPEYSRNLNTGGHNEMETKYVTAKQKIFHSDEYNSYLLLPIVTTK